MAENPRNTGYKFLWNAPKFKFVESSSYAYFAESASFATTASYSLVSITSSITVSSSFADTASYTPNAVVTASATANDITFTKGDGSTFVVTVENSTDTGSLLTTASFSDPNLTFTKGDGTTFNVDISSLTVTSASYAFNATSASYAVSASYEIIKELSSSYADTASFAQSGNGIFSGSFSGSFEGDGSGLTGVISASYAFNATSASYADTASYVNPLNQDVFINGDLYVTGSLSTSGSITHTGSINLLSSSISVVDYIDFNNTGITPPPDIEGRIYWDEDNGTLSLGMHGGQVVQQVGLEEYFYIKNQSGATIPNGSVVRAAGTLGSSGRILGDLMIADGSITYYFTLGIATEDIVNGDDGYVTQFGAVRGIDTTGTAVSESWNDGDVLWVSPTVLGGLTKFEPDSPDLKMQMAIVINAASNGTLFVRPDLSSFLTDLHNVNDFTTTSSFGDLLVKSGSTWINTKQLTGSYGLTGSIEGGDFSGSFSGSFEGDGSRITGVTASFVPPGLGGIYGGSGTVPTSTIATITDSLTFSGSIKVTDTVFIGNVTPSINSSASIYIVQPSASSSTESPIIRVQVEDALSQLRLDNFSGTDGLFVPRFLGIQNDTSAQPGMYIDGVITGSLDTGLTPALIFRALRSDAGVGAEVTSRNLFQWRNLNSPKMTMDSDGNLGINDTSPTMKLSVSGQGVDGILLNPNTQTGLSEQSSRLMFNNATSGNGVTLYTTSGSLNITTGATPLISSGTTRIYVSSAGLVGIGTSSPTNLLDVNGTTRHRNDVLIDNTRQIYWNDNTGVFPTSVDNKIRWRLNDDSAEIYAWQSSSNDIDFVFRLTDDAITSTDNYVFWIDSNITAGGEANDRYPLEMNGEQFIVNAQRRYAVTGSNVSSSNVDFYVLNSGSSGITDSLIHGDVSTNRVGINKSNPEYTLDVNGTTNINGNTTITGSVDVLNGNVNLTANAYFFQGSDTGGTNVSLIGVNSSDQIYIGNQGFTNIIADDTIISGSTTISGSLTVTSLLESSSTALVSYNTSSGEVFYTNDPVIDSLTINNNLNVGGDLTVTGSFISSGSIRFKTYRLTTGSYTASLDDYRIGVRYTQTGSVEIQLPLIATSGEIEYKFKDEEGNAKKNNITIIASGSDLIDGDINAIMNRDYMAIGLYNDGVSNWFIE